jgi:hypothetical protein
MTTTDKTPAAPRSRKLSATERALPPGLRGRLETARLELRALFRAADQVHIAQSLPDELHRLMELDADFAEALHVMDLSPPGIDARAMLRDTLASLDELADARDDFLDSLEAKQRKRLEAHLPSVRAGLPPEAAYIDIPGRDPTAG